MLHLRRRLADRFPLAAHLYESTSRTVAVSRSVPLETPWGFRLRGCELQAGADFEADEVALVQERLADVDAFVDVGANIGLYSCLAARRGVTVVAVEPEVANLSLLYANLVDNGFDEVAVFPLAAGAKPGLRTLYGASTGASLVAGWAGARRGSIVPLATLDAICRGSGLCGRRLLVKIDVEGAELDVLLGAEETLAASPHPSWLVEVAFDEHHPDGLNPHFGRVFETFWGQGYTATEVSTGRIVSRDDVEGWLRTGIRGFGKYNYLFE
jgi:FkbM family methyltransferase